MEIGINAGVPEAGLLTGAQEEVVCYVWYTSTGEVRPVRIKYKDYEGCIQVLDGIDVLAVRRENYCGVPAMFFECRTGINGAEQRFRLLFHIEEQKWTLLMPEAP